MKQQIKDALFTVNVFPIVDFVRYSAPSARWVLEGCTGPAPPPIKRLVVSSYLNRFGLKRFIETGTFLGDTTAYVARDSSIEVTSVELDAMLFEKAQRRFAKKNNVTVLQGDSGVILPRLVPDLRVPALFWLDGHYSGGVTGRAVADTSISSELAAIEASSVKGHVVLIDDARCFDGTKGYPHLSDVLARAQAGGAFSCEVSADIIRLAPRVD